MSNWLTISALLLVASGLQGEPQARSSMGTSREDTALKALQERWHSSYAAGNMAALRPLLTEHFTVTESSGAVLGLSELTRQAAETRDNAVLTASDHRVQLFRDAAIVTSKVHEHRGPISLEFRVTDTFVRVNGRWLVAASQWTRLPTLPNEVKLSTSALDLVAGQYITPRGLKLVVKRRGERLAIVDPQGREEEFIATSDTQFVSPRTQVRYLFLKDGLVIKNAVLANQRGLVPITRIAD